MSIRRRLQSVLWRVPVGQEVRDELAHHLELRARELVDRGWTPDAARAEAARRLRGIEPKLTRLGERRNRAFAWREWLSELQQDVRFAVRQCRLNPGFTAATVLTLALGIGGTTAIFSVVHAVVLKPLPSPNSERVMLVYTTWRDMPGGISAGNYDYIRRRVTVLEQLAAAHYGSFNLADGSEPERVLGMRVTWNYFPVFGVRPQYGRIFTTDDDQPGREFVVVLSHRLWQRRFGADPRIVSQSIRMSGRGYEVIGIMPPSFDDLTDQEELWVPVAFTPERLAMHDEHYLDVYGLRRQDASGSQVNDELGRIAEGLERDHPDDNRERGARAEPLNEFLVRNYRTRLYILLAAVSLVLVIACVNVANLWLARLASRARELAIRSAIGAGRGRIVRQVLTESLVVAALGGLLGLLIAQWAVDLLVANAPAGVPRLGTAGLDGPVVGVACGVVVASTFLFGLWPAWHATRGSGAHRDLGEGKGAAGDSVRPWMRQTLIAAQAALVVVVLAGAALLVRSAIKLQQVPIGFDTSGVLSARVGLLGTEYREPARVRTTFDQILERLQAAHGVALAALDSQPPLLGSRGSNGLIPEGRVISMESAINSQSHFVTPDYFRVLRIPMRSGRAFTDADVRSAPLVMIVNETLAREAFGTEPAIGKRISCCEGAPGRPSWKIVVGVVGDVRGRGPAAEPQPEFYLPMAQIPDVAWTWIGSTMNVLARTAAGDPVSLSGAVRDAVRAIDPTLPVYAATTLHEGLRRTTAQARFNTMLMTLLGLAGLVLAALGIYSVIAWLVALRTREIGVRMALGATAGAVVREMTAQGLRPVTGGLLVGVLGALATGRVMEGQLFQVSARDPIALGAVVVTLLAVAACAALIPAWRAASIDPARALHRD